MNTKHLVTLLICTHRFPFGCFFSVALHANLTGCLNEGDAKEIEDTTLSPINLSPPSYIKPQFPAVNFFHYTGIERKRGTFHFSP